VSPYLDSSVLVALYVPEAATNLATGFVDGRVEPIELNGLHEIEVRNALRLKLFRREINSAQLKAAEEELAKDLASGRLIRARPDWLSIFSVAERLSAALAPHHGVRTLDLLHIAAAVARGASEFVTLDKRQRRAAREAGLEVFDLAV